MATRRLQAVQAPLTKAARQAAIVEILESQSVASQTRLGELLFDKGVQVTQATLSRDLEELGAYKVRTPQGSTYAVPPEQMSLSSVKQRFFRGYCVHTPQIMTVAQQFRAERPQMLALLAQTPGLEPLTLQRATGFLNGFFSDIATDQDVSAKVLKRCAS